jgi:hypothetical protein
MLKAVRVDENADKFVLADYFESFAKALREGRATPAFGHPAREVTKFGRVWSVNVNAKFLDTTPDEAAQKRAFQKAMAGARHRAARHLETARDIAQSRTPSAYAKRSQESATRRSRSAR